ncbi:MAG: ATP-binding protein [Syntrophales bacterium]|nr:ATP-binding protein [Syntrophales bacterium]
MERGLIYTLDNKKQWLICRAVYPKPNLLYWRSFSLEKDRCVEVSSFTASETLLSDAVALTPLDHRIQELTNRRHLLCIPFNIEKENQGLLCLEWSNGILPENIIGFVKIQLLLLGICIERNHFKKKFEDITRRLFSFHHSITAVNYTTQYEETIRIHLATMLDFVSGSSASLMLTRNGPLQFKLALEKGTIRYSNPTNAAPALEEWVLKNRLPFFVSTDAQGETKIIIPLISRKEPLGTITLLTEATSRFIENENKLLSFCTSHLARVIDHYNLFRDIQLEKNYIGSILNSSPVGILIADTNGKVVALNQRAAECLNLSWTGFIVEAEELHCPDFLKEILKDQKGDMVWPVEVDLAQEGVYGHRILNVTAAKVWADNDVLAGFAIALQNVTEKKALEQEVERVNKLAVLGTIAAGVAHEIRNPLMSLSLFLDEIHDKFSKRGDNNFLSTQERKLLEGALKQVDRLDKIVSTLLDFAAKEKKEIKSVDLKEVVDEIMEFIRRRCAKNDIKIEKHYENIPKILTDEQKLKQALLNICLNAIQAMPRGGILKAETSSHDEGHVKISIFDTGKGIEKENIKKVFLPFFSTKESGIGFGLSITEKLVMELRGKITLSSEPGQGTEFSLIFPNN